MLIVFGSVLFSRAQESAERGRLARELSDKSAELETCKSKLVAADATRIELSASIERMKARSAPHGEQPD